MVEMEAHKNMKTDKLDNVWKSVLMEKIMSLEQLTTLEWYKSSTF